MAIYLDREGVDACVSAIATQITELESAAGSIDKTMTSELGNYWQGSSYAKSQATYEEKYQDMLKTKIPNMVGELKKFIDDCKKAIVETDEQLAGS